MRALALVAALTAAAPVHAFTAQNGLVVQPDANGFTVPWRGAGGPADFWCAAGDYAVRVLHLAPTDTVYRASDPKRRSGEPVRFTLDASQSVEKTGLFIIGAKGGGISVGHAQSMCENRRFIDN